MLTAEHRIFESEVNLGNMGASNFAWRAFCTCGWVSERTTDRDRYDELVAEHLAVGR